MKSRLGVSPHPLRSWQCGAVITALAFSGCGEAIRTAQIVKTEAEASAVASLFQTSSIAVCVSLVDASIVKDLRKDERFPVTPAFATLHPSLPAVRSPADADQGAIIELFGPTKQHSSYFVPDAMGQSISTGGGVVGCYAASELELKTCSSGDCETRGAFEFQKR